MKEPSGKLQTTRRERFWLFLSTCAVWVASRLLPGKGWVINVDRKP